MPTLKKIIKKKEKMEDNNVAAKFYSVYLGNQESFGILYHICWS